MALEEQIQEAVTAEVFDYLKPYLQRMVREYILLDRNQAFESLSVSRAFFDKNIKNKPQVKLAERKFPESDKVFYEPTELKKAILSLTKF
ncbi:hypothetical protein [Levilactobacillus senmaizukei]|uniref:hypothetical protein n=1 Tax=Levilactobacillus senmaizukei TaxID=431273 RepID=UPI00077C04A0|nr:hypothetical protein [Levilactobacillus senmaizukei]